MDVAGRVVEDLMRVSLLGMVGGCLEFVRKCQPKILMFLMARQQSISAHVIVFYRKFQ